MPAPKRTVTTEPSFAEFAATRDPRLRESLVEAHLGLAHQLARRFANRGESHEDLVQVASVALIHAVDRFDPDRGFEFSTFATRTILGELKRHFRDKGWAVRAPRRIQELYLELGAATDALAQELGHPPRPYSRPWRPGRPTGRRRSTHRTVARARSPPASARSMPASTGPITTRCWVQHSRSFPSGSSRSCGSAMSTASRSRRSPSGSG